MKMSNDDLIREAEKFLIQQGSKYSNPGRVGRIKEDCIEVIFMKPDALNSRVVIDPPDIRLWVDKQSGKVELIYQM